MDIRTATVSKEVEVVTKVLKDEKVVTLILSEREAKVLGCLIGTLSATEAERLITTQSMDFGRWLGKLEDREVVRFVESLYDNLFEQL